MKPKLNVAEKIEVPDYMKDVAALWHDGQNSLLYSVASTGKVEYQRIYQLLNDLPHVGDDPNSSPTEDTQLRNARAWCNSFLDDGYFENLEQAMVEEEANYSLV